MEFTAEEPKPVHLVTQHSIPLKSAETEAQLLQVIARPYLASLIAPATHDRLNKLLAAAEAVIIEERIVACRDPTDRDADLLVLTSFRGIPIIAPGTFVQGAAR